MDTFILRVGPPINSNTTGRTPYNLTDKIDGWRRSIRAQGGYWMGDFTMTGQLADLTQFFYQYIGGHTMEMSAGKVTWEGLIYEMDLLSPNGVTRRISLDTMYNHVKTVYLTQDIERGTSDIYQNENSQGIYGRREEILTLDGYDSTVANNNAQTFLKEHEWTYPRVTGLGKPMETGDAELNVSVCGYVFTANWRYLSDTSADGSDGSLSVYLSDIISNDCEFLTAGGIEANAITVTRTQPIPRRCWDEMMEKVELGGSTGLPYRMFVDNSRRIFYRQIDNEPNYYLRGGNIYESAGGAKPVNQWTVKPFVVRDMDYKGQKYFYDGWLDDARDFYIEEVEAGTGSGLVLKTGLFSESEILAAQAEYKSRLEQKRLSSDQSYGAAHTGGNKYEWMRYGLKTAEWEKMSPAERNEWRERWKNMPKEERYRTRYRNQKERGKVP